MPKIEWVSNTLKGTLVPFVAVPTESLPKRLSRGREFDKATADALLALVSVAGQSASDGVEYKTAADARKEAGKARRLLVRVAPDPELVKSRVYETEKDSNKWHWAVSLATEKPKSKSKGK